MTARKNTNSGELEVVMQDLSEQEVGIHAEDCDEEEENHSKKMEQS